MLAAGMDTTHDDPPPTSLLPDEIQRDSDIWFEDGNVIVIAQDTAFRFHKGVLSHHSQVFRDLFLIPQPSSSGASPIDILDGCPVVRISDTSYDFRELLRAIYGGVSYLHPDRSATFPVLAALGRLAHKYQLDQLLEAVVHRLKGTFTTQLDAWDRSGGFEGVRSPLRLTSRHAIEALNLIRLLDKPEMVPTALYGCCQLGPEALVRGVKREDGVSLECLSPSDLVLCWKTKETLVRRCVHLLSRLCQALAARIRDAANDGRCPSPFICVVTLKALLDNRQDFLHGYMDEDPLDDYFMTKLDEEEGDETMCSACVDALKTKLSELRKEVWTNLPKLMGLEVEGWTAS